MEFHDPSFRANNICYHRGKRVTHQVKVAPPAIGKVNGWQTILPFIQIEGFIPLYLPILKCNRYITDTCIKTNNPTWNKIKPETSVSTCLEYLLSVNYSTIWVYSAATQIISSNCCRVIVSRCQGILKPCKQMCTENPRVLKPDMPDLLNLQKLNQCISPIGV